jgi:hypothetical protein
LARAETLPSNFFSTIAYWVSFHFLMLGIHLYVL